MISQDHAPVYVISVAAELAEMHPQTLRQYDRLGLVSPSRAPGRSRRYSPYDVDMLREIQRLSHAGVSLEGIKRIMQLENQVAALQAKVKELREIFPTGLIISPSHEAVQSDVPPENIEAMFRESNKVY